MTDIIKYKCPILNTEDGTELDVLVKLSDTKILGIICPEYDPSKSICTCQSENDEIDYAKDRIKEKYSLEEFGCSEEYEQVEKEIKKKTKFPFFMKNSDKQTLEGMINKRRVELMNEELKEIQSGNDYVKCILAEGFKELK